MGPLDATVNFAKSTLSAGYAAGVTSITLIAGGGARFPAVPFNAVWWNASNYSDPADDPTVEIVRVTNIAGDVLTVTRGQEGTADQNHNTPGIIYKLIEGITSSQMDIISEAFAVTPANQVWASPDGAPGPASFRVLVAADLPFSYHGNTATIQMSDNSGAPGNVAVFDGSGNVTDGGVPAASIAATTNVLRGDGSGNAVDAGFFASAIHGNTATIQMSDNSGTTGHLAAFDANGNLTDGPLPSTIPATTNVLAGDGAGGATDAKFAALFSNQGSVVLAIGTNTAQNNTGTFSTFIGDGAGQNNTGASDITAFGANAAQNNSGVSITALGEGAASNNTGNTVTACGATAAGINSGSFVIAIGEGALSVNSGANCTAVGYQAAGDKTAGAGTTVIGAGHFLTGTQRQIEKSTVLGSALAGAVVNNSGGALLTNIIAINGAATDSNQTVIGNAGTILFSLFGVPKFNSANGTGAGIALLGANSPSAHLAAPYTWVDVLAADGTLCTMPIWQK